MPEDFDFFIEEMNDRADQISRELHEVEGTCLRKADLTWKTIFAFKNSEITILSKKLLMKTIRSKTEISSKRSIRYQNMSGGKNTVVASTSICRNCSSVQRFLNLEAKHG